MLSYKKLLQTKKNDHTKMIADQLRLASNPSVFWSTINKINIKNKSKNLINSETRHSYLQVIYVDDLSFQPTPYVPIPDPVLDQHITLQEL